MIDETNRTDNGEPNDLDDFQPTRPDIDIGEDEEVRKYYVNQIPVSVVNERVQYYGKDGKLITESLKDYSKKI